MRTRALDKNEYRLIIDCIKTGFKIDEGTVVKANPRIAMALQCEALLGLRISDILRLRLDQFLQEGTISSRYKRKRQVRPSVVSYPWSCTVQSVNMQMNGVLESIRSYLILQPEVYSAI